MRFVDECKFRVQAGNGGNGCAAFRREAFVPFGGPAGGDGGAGGHVVLVGDEGKSSLLDLTHAHLISAEHGENGRSRDQYGKAGRSEYVRVPVGTVVYDADSGELLGELLSHGQELVVAEGGKGGRGNKHFATPTDRAPKRAEPGTKGESRNLRLELRVMADVGLLGFPNVGKSTFIATVSAARPKIADYPFTTLVPQLGVVRLDDWIPAQPEQTLVAADIPGLVPGAAEGAGLGIRFLRHLERTRALLHLIALDPAEDREPLADYHVVRDELARYSPELAARPEVIALSKGDLTETQEAYPELKAKFKEAGKELYLLSAPTHQGISDVLGALRRLMEQAGKEV
ncbi:MAG: GTPase ObgE [Sorangiineae bacterium NIC37A_2]|nr:MAG: GTPase ObgE [Sorangiineae bacterium NIC37A_2]